MLCGLPHAFSQTDILPHLNLQHQMLDVLVTGLSKTLQGPFPNSLPLACCQSTRLLNSPSPPNVSSRVER